MGRAIVCERILGRPMATYAAQARRLLALAAVRAGMNRTEAARIGGMGRQTLGTGCTVSTSTVRTG